MDFRFTTEYPASRLDEIISYLLGPRLWIPQNDYPDFLDWAEKAHKELRRENKRAMVTFSGLEIAGVAVYQRHKRYKEALEIKNLTVCPDMRGKGHYSWPSKYVNLPRAEARGLCLALAARGICLRFAAGTPFPAA